LIGTLVDRLAPRPTAADPKLTHPAEPNRRPGENAPDGASARPRRSEVDAIRIITCFSVIFGHVIAIFGLGVTYHLKAPELSPFLGGVYELRHAWSMPAFFMMAGWSAVAALRTKGFRVFVDNRIRRLLIPLVAGMVLITPTIKYVEGLGGLSLRLDGMVRIAPLTESFPSFLSRYFTNANLHTWSHLWFLAYLIVISALTYPLLRTLANRAQGWPQLAAIQGAFLAYAPAILLGLWLVLSHGWWPYYPSLIYDYANFVFFALFFLMGAAVSAWPALDEAIRREWWRLGLLGVAALIAMLWFVDTLAGRALVGVGAWGIVCALYGGLGRIRWRRGPVFRYLSDAVMPLFIIHHVIVVVAGYLLLQTGLGMWIVVALLLVIAVALPLLIYQVAIRPWPPMRLLFGAPRQRPR
jgi:peptidoglycan/LPS O-acetylase OafA/YrhL